MHIPDGVLAPPVWLSLDLAAPVSVFWLARRAQASDWVSQAPLMGVMGAFVFAVQMINFPIAPGTSTHLLGTALLTYTLGPSVAAIVMTAVLALQALVFQDGGVLALGANVCNMALVATLAAYLPVWGLGPAHRSLGIFLGSWLSVVLAGSLAVIELTLSGVSLAGWAVLAALGLLALTGAVEGAATLAAVRALSRVSPFWAETRPAPARRVLAWVGLASLLLATGGALLASAAPDVLESLLEASGVQELGQLWFRAPLSDYVWPGDAPEWFRQILAGLVGVAFVLATSFLVYWLVRRHRKVGA